MTPTGWVKLHRQIVEWEWYSDINTTRVFLHIVLTANWKAGKFCGIEIPQGSRMTSYETIANETSLTVKQVRLAVEKLKKGTSLVSKRAGSGLLLTVCNYASYNSICEGEGHEKGTRSGTQKAREGHEKGNNIRREEGKNEKKEETGVFNFDYESPNPLPFPSSEFSESWEHWKAHRKETKKPLTERSQKMQLQDLKEMGEKRSIVAIRHSIKSGYQGIFEPIGFNQSQQPETPAKAAFIPPSDWQQTFSQLFPESPIPTTWESLDNNQKYQIQKIQP